MVLADLGTACLTGDIIGQELTGQRLVSCVRKPGGIEFDGVFYCRDEGLARPMDVVMATMDRLS